MGDTAVNMLETVDCSLYLAVLNPLVDSIMFVHVFA